MYEHKNIKEQSTFLATSGQIDGGFLFIAGSIYGSIDTEHAITLIYETYVKEKYLHRAITLPLNSIDIITIGVNETPYFTVNEILPYSFEEKTNKANIQTITLFLPESWKILDRKQP